MTLAPGALVSDRLRLERLLGEGGMGCVWIAQHLTLGTRVAVKFVSAELAASHPEIAARFSREAAAAAKITSPHVVRTLDFGATPQGTPYLVMELLEGESLAERLEREQRVPPAEAATIVSHVANALSEAHRLGVVHRDIKPGNIFLTRAGRAVFAKVLDFGIARDVAATTGAATQTGALLGTPQYMSPEQLMSAKGVDSRADLWALAVTAYEMLVGTPPFVGETMPKLIVSIHAGEFAPPSSGDRAPFVVDTAALDAFFARAFARDPARRFGDALDLAEAFAGVCASGPSGATAPGGLRTVAGVPLEVTSAPSGVGPAHADTAIAPARTQPSTGATLNGRVPWLLAAAGCIALISAGVFWVATRSPASKEGSSTTEAPALDRASSAAAPAGPETGAPSVATPTTTASLSASGGAQATAKSLDLTVEAGTSPATGIWMSSFGAKGRATTSESLQAAFAACRGDGRFLCSESQWARACEADSRVGTTRAWVASVEAGHGVTRGGAAGCAERAPARAGEGPFAVACCDRAIGTRGRGGEAFLTVTSKKLLAYEAAMNAGRVEEVAAHYSDTVSFLGAVRGRDEQKRLGASYFRSNPDQATVYDVCDLSVDAAADEWRASCQTLLYRGGRAWGLEQTLVFAGLSGKLLRVGEAKVGEVK